MKVVGIAVLLAGIFFTLYTFIVEPVTIPTSNTSGWEPWIGMLVIATGAVTIYRGSGE